MNINTAPTLITYALSISQDTSLVTEDINTTISKDKSIVEFTHNDHTYKFWDYPKSFSWEKVEPVIGLFKGLTLVKIINIRKIDAESIKKEVLPLT